jgi:hypothetical protein
VDENLINNELSSPFLVIRRNDVAIDSIIFPKTAAEFKVNTLVQPKIAIHNLGVNDLTNVEVKCQSFISNVLVYSSSKTVNIQSLASSIITFDSLLTSSQGRYVDIKYSVFKTGDQLRSNDSSMSFIVFNDNSSIDHLNTPHSLVFPNPFYDKVQLESPTITKSVRIIDGIGHEILVQKILNRSYELDLSGFSSGVYTLELHSEFGVERQLIIKN